MFANRNRKNPYHYGYSGQMTHGYQYNLPENGRSVPQSQYQPIQNYNWNSYGMQNPYFAPAQINQPSLPLNPSQPQYNSSQYYQGGYGGQSFTQAPSMQSNSQFLFENPLQPQEEYYPSPNPYSQMSGYPNANPYPKQSFVQKQPGGMQSFMNSFKSQDGSVDFNKMMNTAGQMMTAVNQVSSLVKGLGGMFKV